MTVQQIDQLFDAEWQKPKPFPLPSAHAPFLSHELIRLLCRHYFHVAYALAIGAEPAPPQPAEPSGKKVDEHLRTIVSEPPSPEETFIRWWNLYDKKRGREKCLRKWLKLSKKEQADCIAATPKYVQATPDKQFRKDPYTYLHNKAWHDEIIVFCEQAKATEQQRLEEAARLIAKYGATP